MAARARILLILAGAVLVSSTLASSAMAAPADDRAGPELVEKAGVLMQGSLPFTGDRIERFPDGAVYMSTHYLRGLKDGTCEQFATSGELRARYNYRAGVKDGLQQGWYIEGPKRFEARFKHGILEGMQTEWHQNGNVFRQQEFKDGVEVSRKILYETSEVYTNYVKKNGRLYGIDRGALCFEPAKREGER